MIKLAFFGSAVDPQGAAVRRAAEVNVVTNVHDPAAGTTAVQLFTVVKLPGGLTLAAPTLRIAAPQPLLVIVTVTGGDAVPASAAPKLIEPVGEIVAAACTAVPLTASICGLCGALSDISTWAERLPACVGSKVTFITQALPTARGRCVQLSVSAKSPGFAPAVLKVMATAVVPVLLMDDGAILAECSEHNATRPIPRKLAAITMQNRTQAGYRFGRTAPSAGTCFCFQLGRLQHRRRNGPDCEDPRDYCKGLS